MSAAAPTLPTLPSPTDAYNFLLQEVHARAFLQKCAALGWNPRSDQEAEWMLDTAFKLRVAKGAEKTAGAGPADNPFFALNAAVSKALADKGLDVGIKQAEAQDLDRSLRATAKALASDPRFYNSVLSVKAAQAEDIRRSLQPQ